MDKPDDSETWEKGKKFTFFVLFKVSVYNVQTIKVMESVRYSDKEIFNV